MREGEGRWRFRSGENAGDLNARRNVVLSVYVADRQLEVEVACRNSAAWGIEGETAAHGRSSAPAS